MIEFRNLVKKFGDLVAVDHINLTVKSGEFFCVLGPNAAGKTTSIKMLTGLIRPTEGQVRVCGFDVQEEPVEVRKRLAYVPDFPFLYDKLTPLEFFRFTGRLFGMEEDLMDNRTRDLIPRFSLDPYIDLSIESLSHGTRQRIAIVSALMHAPDVFVLDEPMVGLDPHHARVLKDVLRERATAGMTVFLSTHQLSVAEEMADRIGIIHNGQLIAAGTKEDLREQAGNDGALEDTFLALTREDESTVETQMRQLHQERGPETAPIGD
ncbi:MAG: ABC transporter [Verrucomicrobiales bacterium]|nr:ABC transporter [Verrucomicrobiales bacterium]MBR90944.1 ABC transporter [Verrucomicrobiales bacterium]|tara:strand:+ start:7649 stop:8443 length:795 start_codon:yes stop_codon:yes gene_type:complete